MKHFDNVFAACFNNLVIKSGVRLSGRILRLLLAWTILCITQPAIAQQVIIHLPSAQAEDGNSLYDADGTINNVVVWKGGGTVHVISGVFSLSRNNLDNKPYTLKVEPGAIVKISGRFVIVNGVRQWLPPGSLSGIKTTSDRCPIQIDGATITDIRDDEVGGDTNQDGNNSTPPAGDAIRMEIEFSGTPRDYLRNSTLKYVEQIRYIGSMSITNNKFFMFGEMVSHSSTSLGREGLVNAVPVISSNTFEFAYNHSRLNLVGLHPIIQENTFRYAVGAKKGVAPIDYSAAIIIGTFKYNDARHPDLILPQSGTTRISYNEFETSAGIQVHYFVGTEGASFFARIENNQFQASLDLPGGRGYFALRPEIAGQILFSNNLVNNYNTPLVFDSFFSQTSNLQINYNRFTFPSTAPLNTISVDPKLWQEGHFIEARNNYWGDPTGPSDNSAADGLFNQRGKGYRVSDGIDYVPFTGGTAPNCQQSGAGVSLTSQSQQNLCPDEIHINANLVFPIPLQNLVPNRTAIIHVKVDKYTLASAPTGKIIVVVRMPTKSS